MISDSNLFDYIENLNLKKSKSGCDKYHIINNDYMICIESSVNVFLIDRKTNMYKDKYKFISNIKELKNVYKLKTGKDIEILMRKEKLKQLELCSSQVIK